MALDTAVSGRNRRIDVTVEVFRPSDDPARTIRLRADFKRARDGMATARRPDSTTPPVTASAVPISQPRSLRWRCIPGSRSHTRIPTWRPDLPPTDAKSSGGTNQRRKHVPSFSDYCFRIGQSGGHVDTTGMSATQKQRTDNTVNAGKKSAGR